MRWRQSLQMAEHPVETGAARLEVHIHRERQQLPRLEPFHLNGEAAADLIPAGDFVVKSRFASNRFKLLLPKLLDSALFFIVAIG